MTWLRTLFNNLFKRLCGKMTDFSFIPRDEVTKNIDISRLTQAYVLAASDGTKVAIAVKIDGVWYTYPYDADLDNDLSASLGEAYSKVNIDEWARLISEYEPAIRFMDEKVKQATPKTSTSNTLG